MPQDWKELIDSKLRLEGNESASKDLQPSNAHEPIVINEFGNDTLFKDEQLSNARLSISLTPSSIFTFSIK